VNKQEVIKRIEDGRREIESLWAGATEEQMTARPGTQEDWSVKDLIGHLTYWQNTLLVNVPIALRGEKPTWGDLDETNAQVFERNRDRSLSDVESDFHRSAEQVRGLVESLSEADLNRPNAWNDEVLWQYILGETADHYEYHAMEVRRWRERTIG
jgi:hypothetical protein